MTIYEQIQRALEYIEGNLLRALYQGQAAAAAGMSARSFQEYFWMVTGFSFKEYVVKRRLAYALQALAGSERSILAIALDCGYQSHEAFSRAFKRQFAVSPRHFRQCRPGLEALQRIELFKEMYMGVIVKELPDLRVIGFEGFAPEPEDKAKAKMLAWLAEHPVAGKRRRIFGHNIDTQGHINCTPQAIGYKFFVCLEPAEEAGGETILTIPAGKFVVTGIEGNFQDSPDGSWITRGWQKMNEMMEAKGYMAKQPGRWYEEEIEARTPGNLRLDLYLEITDS